MAQATFTVKLQVSSSGARVVVAAAQGSSTSLEGDSGNALNSGLLLVGVSVEIAVPSLPEIIRNNRLIVLQ